MDALRLRLIQPLRNLVLVSPLQVDDWNAAWLIPKGCVLEPYLIDTTFLTASNVTCNKRPDALNAFLVL